jgi:hypothetical protein
VSPTFAQVLQQVGLAERRDHRVVGAGRVELPTSAVSRQRSPAELRALGPDHTAFGFAVTTRMEAVPGIEPGYRVLQTLA